MARFTLLPLLCAAVIATSTPASANPPGSPSGGVPLAMLTPPAPGTVDGVDAFGRIVGPSEDLANVPVVAAQGGWGLDSVLSDALAARRAAAVEVTTAEADFIDGMSRLVAAQRDARTAADRVTGIRKRLATFRRDLRTLALERFTRTTDLPGLVAGVEIERMASNRRAEVLSAQGTSVVARHVDALQAELADAVDAAEAASAVVSEVLDTIREAGRTRARALEDLERAQSEVDRLRTAVRALGVTTDVAGTDLPVVALDAYWRAARALRLLQPNCGITWWVLAAIGRTESRHGRFGGGRPGPDGTVSVATIGIALDGTNNTRRIGDSDGGLLDGDPVYDRAVGPMQFIPTTWARWATDGNGDGVADPQNIYDAALAAARYLCSSGPIDTDHRLLHALTHYGGARPYALVVLGIAHAYEGAVTGLPTPP